MTPPVGWGFLLQTKWVFSEEAVEMATVRAARVCGLQDEIGSIEQEKLADLVLLNRDSCRWIPLNDVTNQLVFFENGRSVGTVIIGGEIVLDSGRLTGIEEDRIYTQAMALLERLAGPLASDLKRGAALDS